MSTENQDALLEEARAQVAKQQFLMQRKLDDCNLDDALRYAIHMIYELKTSKLSPAKYYELYMQVMNALHDLTTYIEDEATKQKTPAETQDYLDHYYEYVQYSGNIIPRLYLLNCVGGVCLKLQNDPDKRMALLQDMIDMNKGVQHPTRGLFLRNYLSQVARDYLPDVSSPEEEPSEAVSKGIKFVLENFGEMTRLWVRMQHQGAVRDRSKREKERLQLRMLVGTTLRRLVELTAVTKERYQEEVFPAIRDKVIKCKDKIAQEYLMDIVIQIVDDEYHLATLQEFLQTCTKMVKDVNVKNIITSLMDRLAKFAIDNPAVFSEEDVFPTFQEQCATLLSKRKKMSVQDKLELQVSLVNFATNCYPERYEYVIKVWETSLKLLKKLEAKGKTADLEDPMTRSHLVELLTKPVASMKLSALDFENYAPMMEMLGFAKSREAATQIAKHLTTSKDTKISSTEQIDQLFKVIITILQDQPETPEVTSDNSWQFEEENQLVATLINMIHAEDTDDHFECMASARGYLAKGGEERQKYTFPCLLYNSLGLIRRAFRAEREDQRYSLKKMFKFVNQILTAFSTINAAVGIRMYLDSALAADECGYNTAVYGFIEAAFELYEDLGSSKEQRRVMQSVNGTLLKVTSLEDENYETLRQNAVQYCNRLLKKPFQARMVAKAAYLYWNCQNQELKNEEFVLKCLNKGAKIAKKIMDDVVKANVYITLLNHFLYFLKEGVSTIDKQTIIAVGAIIRECISEAGDEEGVENAKNYYRNTIRYIADKELDIDMNA